MADEEKFNLQVPLGLHRMLQHLGETQNPRLRVSVYAKYLLKTYLEIDSLYRQEEKRQLSLRLSRSLKQSLEQKASENRLKASENHVNVSKFARQVLIHGVREELLKRTEDERETKRFWSILLHWGFTFTLLIGMLGIGFWTHGFRNWGPPPDQGSQNTELPQPDIQLRNCFEEDENKSAEYRTLEIALYHAYLEKGIFLFEEKQFQAAINDFEHALTIQATDQVLTYLARAYKEIGEVSKAEAYSQRLEQKNIQK